MNDVTMQTLLITVGLELAVVMLLVGAFVVWRMRKGKNADRKAAQDLVKNVKGNEKDRREGLLKVFGECYEMEDDELNTAVDEFLKRERAFYKTLISVYVDRDASEFSKLTTALEEMVKPYSDLALSAEVSVDSDELNSLQEQNKNLEKELGESKQVMDELMSEYTATFDKEAEGKKPESIQEESKAEEEPAEENKDMEETFEIHIDNIPASADASTNTDASTTKEIKTEAKTEEPVAASPEPESKEPIAESDESTSPNNEIEAELVVNEEAVIEPPAKAMSELEKSILETQTPDDILNEAVEEDVSLDEIDISEIINEAEADLIVDDVKTAEAKPAKEEKTVSEENEVSLDEIDAEVESVKEAQIDTNEVSLDEVDDILEATP